MTHIFTLKLLRKGGIKEKKLQKYTPIHTPTHSLTHSAPRTERGVKEMKINSSESKQ